MNEEHVSNLKGTIWSVFGWGSDRSVITTYTHLNGRRIGSASKTKEHIAQVDAHTILHVRVPPRRPGHSDCRHDVGGAAAVLLGEGDEEDASHGEAYQLDGLTVG